MTDKFCQFMVALFSYCCMPNERRWHCRVIINKAKNKNRTTNANCTSSILNVHVKLDKSMRYSFGHGDNHKLFTSFIDILLFRRVFAGFWKYSTAVKTSWKIFSFCIDFTNQFTMNYIFGFDCNNFSSFSIGSVYKNFK